MGILHTIDERHGLVLSSWVGEIDDAEILPSYRSLYAETSWRPGFDEIVDLRDADMRGVRTETLRKLVTVSEEHSRGKCDGFRSAVIAQDDLPFGLARLYEAVSEQSPELVMVFRDLGRALEWIGIDPRVLDEATRDD